MSFYSRTKKIMLGSVQNGRVDRFAALRPGVSFA